MINDIAIILITHYIADFLFQNNWMAKNKSTNNFPLFVHVCVYTLIMLVLSLYIFDNKLNAWYFAIFNGFFHYAVDFFTSKMSSYMYRNNKMGTNSIPNFSFWSVIGLDQLLHTLILIYTLTWFIAPY